jgi:hypothetical protein
VFTSLPRNHLDILSMQVHVTTLSMFLLNSEELIIPYHSKYNVFAEYGVCAVQHRQKQARRRSTNGQAPGPIDPGSTEYVVYSFERTNRIANQTGFNFEKSPPYPSFLVPCSRTLRQSQKLGRQHRHQSPAAPTGETPTCRDPILPLGAAHIQ